MLSSTLRDLITVYNEQKTAGANDRTRTYTKAFTDRAAITFASGDQQFTAITEMQGKVNKIKVRYALGRYVETMVIQWHDDFYIINSIDPDPRRTYLYITATRAMPGTIKIAVVIP